MSFWSLLLEFGPILAWYRFPAAEEIMVVFDQRCWLFELNADNTLEGLPS